MNPTPDVSRPHVVVCSNTLAEYVVFFRKLLPADPHRTELFAELSDAEYRRLSQGSSWALLWLRFRMLVVYTLRLWWRMRRSSGKVVFVVTTNTFFAPWVAATFGRRRGVSVVHLLYDLYPEALAVAAGSEPGTLTKSLIAGITRRTLQRADATVFIGRRLREYAEGRYGAAKRASVIEVGSDVALFEGPPASPLDGPLRMLYSGQLGRMHDLETLAQLLEGPATPGFEIVLQASGAGYAALQSRSRATAWPVSWGAPLATADWAASMQRCHLGLVTVKAGAENVVFPSKAFSALLAGQALLAICPDGSDLADLVRRHDCGFVVAPGDVEGLRRALALASSDRAGLLELQRRAQAAGRLYYSLEALRPAWERVIDEMASAP
jgi:glycosyltransferase involved in cell wall biosynthesis